MQTSFVYKLLVLNICINSYTVFTNFFGSIPIDYTFIHCTYIFRIKREIYRTVISFRTHSRPYDDLYLRSDSKHSQKTELCVTENTDIHLKGRNIVATRTAVPRYHSETLRIQVCVL